MDWLICGAFRDVAKNRGFIFWVKPTAFILDIGTDMHEQTVWTQTELVWSVSKQFASHQPLLRHNIKYVFEI